MTAPQRPARTEPLPQPAPQSAATMSIAVERRYRVTTNGAAHDLSEDEARALAFGLLTALGIAPTVAAPEPAEMVVAAIESPAQLPSRVPSGLQVQEPLVPRMTSKKSDPVLRSWQADEPELRRLHAEGLSNRDIAARLGRSAGAVSVKLAALGLRRAAVAPTAVPEPAAVAAFPPAITTGESAAVQGSVGWVPDGRWTFEQTKALIRAMAPGHGGIREAADATGHSMGGCGLRWKHLKNAGLMTIEKYMSSPEYVS